VQPFAEARDTRKLDDQETRAVEATEQIRAEGHE
jgi:hypothetical protein